jgi:hypothetical protein
MVEGGLQRSLVLSRQTARLTRRTVKHHRRGHGTWPRALRVDRGGRDNRSGRLINWLIAAARSLAGQLELLLRPDRSLEPFGPVGPSAQSTTRAI